MIMSEYDWERLNHELMEASSAIGEMHHGDPATRALQSLCEAVGLLARAVRRDQEAAMKTATDLSAVQNGGIPD